ncbi:hypothetical protein [Piscinibacter sp. XHJ-5]|uniref:hypothetical protein n=1 Tax=Piscinibacter sp. XHJ-5 TaxID=3037797 RepID=UPI002452AF32|nr:hypothetical protein [Piscinibacter sp. XHJ-5]
MKAATLDKLIWTLVYAGLAGVGLGLSVQRSDDAIGWSLVGVGAVAAVVGALLVVVRSRMRDPQ